MDPTLFPKHVSLWFFSRNTGFFRGLDASTPRLEHLG